MCMCPSQNAKSAFAQNFSSRTILRLKLTIVVPVLLPNNTDYLYVNWTLSRMCRKEQNQHMLYLNRALYFWQDNVWVDLYNIFVLYFVACCWTLHHKSGPNSTKNILFDSDVWLTRHSLLSALLSVYSSAVLTASG